MYNMYINECMDHFCILNPDIYIFVDYATVFKATNTMNYINVLKGKGKTIKKRGLRDDNISLDLNEAIYHE